MSLPVNIKELINGLTVEWERIEFKKGWNPVSVLHSICAFANDFGNWGGGYIIIGIEEKDGCPVLPPVGIKIEQMDKIQKELLNLCNKLYPTYFPVVEPVHFQGEYILILWVPGGQNRPYKAPVVLGKQKEYAYYIRRFSNTIKAQNDDERELLSLTASIPFDDRINHNATIQDLN
jgi:ATP-dependent DNA helicase RecG